jgi:preprotein translocase subunit SecA
MREVERRVVLSVLDRKWREHLYEMDYLREGIGLRGYGQRDPLIEYQREGYDMFSAMMDGIKEESVGHLFNLEVQIQENPIVEETAVAGAVPPGAPAAPLPGGAVSAGGAVPGGAVPGGAVPGDAPGAAGQAGRGGVPAQAGPARAAQGGTAAPKRDGGAQAPRRDSRARGGAQAPKRDGRVSNGAHARRAGTAPDAPSAPIPAGFAPRQPQRLQYSAPSVDGGTHVETSQGPAANDDFARVGRNDPCPCGSGRKYKRCHGDPRMRPDG